MRCAVRGSTICDTLFSLSVSTHYSSPLSSSKRVSYRKEMKLPALVTLIAVTILQLQQQLPSVMVAAFAADNNNGNKKKAVPLTLFDRFRVTCPADVDCIRSFDPSLIDSDSDDVVWAAVHRSSNNMPSVLVKDEFLHAMRSATGAINVGVDRESTENGPDTSMGSLETHLQQNQPVAVARLRPSDDVEHCHVMDSMRCILKKENMDESCDGGSEHNEAISVAIDALLHHYLKKASSKLATDAAANSDAPLFEGTIRTKATLFSSKLLEDRGFAPVTNLQKDMASHISSLDACLEKFAERSVSSVAKNPASRQRALEIVSMLGRLDRDQELVRAKRLQDLWEDKDGSDEVDPWAGMKKFF